MARTVSCFEHAHQIVHVDFVRAQLVDHRVLVGNDAQHDMGDLRRAAKIVGFASKAHRAAVRPRPEHVRPDPTGRLSNARLFKVARGRKKVPRDDRPDVAVGKIGRPPVRVRRAQVNPHRVRIGASIETIRS